MKSHYLKDGSCQKNLVNSAKNIKFILTYPAMGY
jgi:hypothetical protein